MRILLTNDDGIDAPGLHALYRAVRGLGLGEVHVVAPATVQSAMSHAVTFHRPMRVIEHDDGLIRGYSVEGRPADCVKLAIDQLVPGPIDLVLSGMNSGANVGVYVRYSGTVAAAMEGAINGIPSIAVSLHIGEWEHDHWDRAAAHAAEQIRGVMDAGLQPGTAMNLNIPILDHGAEPKPAKAVPISMKPAVSRYTASVDKDGALYAIDTMLDYSEVEPGTDVEALFAGHITLSPLVVCVGEQGG